LTKNIAPSASGSLNTDVGNGRLAWWNFKGLYAYVVRNGF